MDDLTAGMTLDEQIGRLFVVGFPDHDANPELLDLIQCERVGGVILFSRNVRDQAQTAALTHTLQSTARAAGHPAPLLVMIDQENGLVRRLGHDSTPFPGAMALGAIEDAEASERIVEEVARATAQELLAHGVNMNLAPVMDVNNAPENPVIGVRSFGADPEVVGRLGVASMRGLQGAGVIATLKHFPGHGDTTVDSHLALPVVTAPPERLEAVELAPFRQGIAAGAECVMTAHVAFPALTGDATIPATLAPEALTDLLRERLGFAGVIMSDCLEMDAIAGTVGVESGSGPDPESGRRSRPHLAYAGTPACGHRGCARSGGGWRAQRGADTARRRARPAPEATFPHVVRYATCAPRRGSPARASRTERERLSACGEGDSRW